MLGHKWLTRYRAIDATSAQALRVADERIAASAYEAGRDGLLAALRIDPGNPMLLNRLAACLRPVGDPRTALAAMRRACDVDRRASELWVQLALLNHECGDRAEAGECWHTRARWRWMPRARLGWRPLPGRWSTAESTAANAHGARAPTRLDAACGG